MNGGSSYIHVRIIMCISSSKGCGGEIDIDFNDL